jgi:Flp pilus assembly protein TadG
VTVEFAIVSSFTLLLLIGLIVTGFGVFRYQEMATLAREGARWASVHGWQYQQTTGNLAATPQEVYDNAIASKIVGLDLSKLTYSVTWEPDNFQGSYVNVTLNYQWVPEALFGGLTLTSTSRMPISY